MFSLFFIAIILLGVLAMWLHDRSTKKIVVSHYMKKSGKTIPVMQEVFHPGDAFYCGAMQFCKPGENLTVVHEG